MTLVAAFVSLPDDEQRESIERMVLRLRGAGANIVRTQQQFLRTARWDDPPILAAHRELVVATLGETKGVLAIDGIDIPKDGTESVRGVPALWPVGQAGQLLGLADISGQGDFQPVANANITSLKPVARTVSS